MTIEQFYITSYRCGDKVSFKGQYYEIEAIDFEQCLFGINETGDGNQIDWKRCENVDFITSNTPSINEHGDDFHAVPDELKTI
jgi:hypothetical protein